MKKLFMEPEMKVTKFEYEDIMATIHGSRPDLDDSTNTDTDFE